MNHIQGYSQSKPSTKTSQALGGNASIFSALQLQERTVRDSKANHFKLGVEFQQLQEQV